MRSSVRSRLPPPSLLSCTLCTFSRARHQGSSTLAVLEIRFLALPSINAVKHFPLAIVDRGGWSIWKTSRRAAKHSGAKSRSSHGSLTGRSVSSSMLRSVVHESAPACRGGRRFDPDYLHQNSSLQSAAFLTIPVLLLNECSVACLGIRAAGHLTSPAHRSGGGVWFCVTRCQRYNSGGSELKRKLQ